MSVTPPAQVAKFSEPSREPRERVAAENRAISLILES
jgi:hypothetical protein